MHNSLLNEKIMIELMKAQIQVLLLSGVNRYLGTYSDLSVSFHNSYYIISYWSRHVSTWK